jgi:hypothetical protein
MGVNEIKIVFSVELPDGPSGTGVPYTPERMGMDMRFRQWSLGRLGEGRVRRTQQVVFDFNAFSFPVLFCAFPLLR